MRRWPMSPKPSRAWAAWLLACVLVAPAARADEPAPAPSAEPPLELPPPKRAIDSGDLDWRSRDVGLGPPLPPPDPFLPRHIQLRHDTRDVSADGRLKPVKRVPQWVDVIERPELTEWRPLDIGVLARRLPNVVVGDAGSPFLQIPSIRGFGGDRVKVLTDGVWPTSQALGLEGATLSLWDPESTERVEVYHGPGAYLKGLDAPGGVFNVVPRRPRRHGCLTADGAVSSSFSSATRTFRERAEADVGVDRIAGLFGATWSDHGNRDTGGGTLEPTSYDQIAADAAVDWFLDNQSTIGITGQYMKADDVGAPLGTGLAAQPEFERTFLALTVSSFDAGTVFHGHRASISLDTFFQKDDNAFDGSTQGLATEQDADRFDLHLEGNLYLFECHDTWAELTVSYAHVDRSETIVNAAHRGNAPLAVADSQYEAAEWVVTGLVEDQVHEPCWDRHLGLRFDWYHYDDSRPDSPSDDRVLVGGSAGVARHFTSCLTGFGNVSLGWRRPTIHERTATTVIDGRTILGNPDVDPELHGNVEVGVKASREDRASLQLALFGHYTDDFIAPVDVLPLGANQARLENLGSAFLYGTELAGAWRPCTTIEGLELFGSLGTTRSTDEDVVHGFPLLYRVGSRYSVPQPKGYLVRRWFAEAAFHGATDSRDGLRGGDPYQTADVLLGLSLDLGCRRAGHATLGVTNLFDADYTPPTATLPAAGLSLVASLAVQF